MRSGEVPTTLPPQGALPAPGERLGGTYGLHVRTTFLSGTGDSGFNFLLRCVRTGDNTTGEAHNPLWRGTSGTAALQSYDGA